MSEAHVTHPSGPFRSICLGMAAVVLGVLSHGPGGSTQALAAETADQGEAIAASDAPRENEAGPVPLVHNSPGSQFHIGDRLQINFLEYLDLTQPASDATGGGGATMRTFYQRLDLTGEYRVDIDVTIAIPLLGRFEVGNKTLDQLRAEIAVAFERETNRSGEVHVAILERQPIFVMGVVRNPGSYAFAPGMIAIQAIALAGGFERASEAATQQLDALRERERLAQAMQRLTRLTVQRARLIEERDGEPVAVSHPLLALAAEDTDELLDAERGLLEVQTTMRQGVADLQEASLGSARGELTALQGSAALVDRQIEARTERLRVLQQMQGRGATNLEAVWAAQKDVTDFELQREQLLSSIHLAEQKVAQAESALSMTDLDHRARVTADLLSVENEIAQLETTIATAQEVAGALEAVAAARGAGPRDVIAIEILRRGEKGVTTMTAAESTDLMPGDVVKVVVEKRDMIHTAQAVRP